MLNQVLSRITVALCALTLAFPVNYSRAEDAFNSAPSSIANIQNVATNPDADNICKRLDDAAAGSDENGPLKNSEGKPIDFTKDCDNPYQQDVRVSSICKWRALSNEANSQAPKYCKARKLASKAKKSAVAVAALDLGAAAICTAEYYKKSKLIKEAEVNIEKGKNAIDARRKAETEKKAAEARLKAAEIKLAASSTNPVAAAEANIEISKETAEIAQCTTRIESAKQAADSAFQIARNSYAEGATPRACGGASMAAGVAELVGFISLKGETYNGSMKINEESGQVEDRNKVTAIRAAISIGASIEGLRMGSCYYNLPTCVGAGKSVHRLNDAETAASRYARKHPDHVIVTPTMAWPTSIINAYNAERLKTLAKESALLFAALGAMRGLSYAKADKTEKSADSMITGLVSNAVTAGAGIGSGGVMAGGYSGYGAGTPTSTVNRSGAIASDMPEASLLPRGSPLATQAESVMAGLSDNEIGSRLSSGNAAGVAASIASSLGADGSELAAAGPKLEKFMASLPSSDQGKYAAGSGSLGGSKGGSGGDTPNLNLGALFGQNGAPEAAGPESGIAFRGPAQETDIWHSNTDKNLFQIVSGKYEDVHHRIVTH